MEKFSPRVSELSSLHSVDFRKERKIGVYIMIEELECTQTDVYQVCS